MRLKLQDLQQIVEKALVEERMSEAFRAEIKRVLGPSVIAEGKIEQIAEAANDRIDVLDRTGRSGRLAFKSSVMIRYLNHGNPEVRKLAARVVPEKFLSKLASDKNHAVRATVARRIPLNAVSEMLKRFPSDDEVRVIYKQRKLAESGIKAPKVQDEPFDMYGEERLGDAVKQSDGVELSETWYRSKAMQFMADYGGNIEDAWEELAAHRYASSLKATSGVEIDESRLLKAIKELIEEREERALERDALKETVSFLRRMADDELMQESAMPIIELDVDPVRELIESNHTPSNFIEQANSLFKVRESTIPGGIRKYRMGEHGGALTSVPVVGCLPHDKGFRAIDERALDMYCEAWNKRQQLNGEPMRIEWSTHPDAVGKVSFIVSLR